MYTTIDLINQEIKKINWNWNWNNKTRKGSQIEQLVMEREKDAKIFVLTELKQKIEHRKSLLVFTKENTTIHTEINSDENIHCLIIKHKDKDVEINFTELDHFGGKAYIKNADRCESFALIKEGKFYKTSNFYAIEDFFIEYILLEELTEMAGKFFVCEECGESLNDCCCCGECSCAECECEFCHECGESFDYCECDER